MIAAALRCELRIPNAQSLKQRRAALRPVLEGLKRIASVSVAEVGHQNSWQRATIGVAVVSRGSEIDALVELVQGYLDSRVEVELLEVEVGYLDSSSGPPEAS